MSVSISTTAEYMESPFHWLLGTPRRLLKMSDHFVDHCLSSLCHLKANILIFLSKEGRASGKLVFITSVIKLSRPGLLICMPVLWRFWLSIKLKCLSYCGLISVSVIRSVCCPLCTSGFALNFFG